MFLGHHLVPSLRFFAIGDMNFRFEIPLIEYALGMIGYDLTMIDLTLINYSAAEDNDNILLRAVSYYEARGKASKLKQWRD